MCEDEFMRNPEASPLDMVKALGDPVRLRIISALTTPRTVKQVGDFLGEDASKLYYHVKELYRVGLVDLVETRVVGGVAEKYYCAGESTIDEAAQQRVAELCEEDPEAAAKLIGDLLNSVLASVMTEFSWMTGRIREKAEGDGDLPLTVLAKFLKLTPGKAREMAETLGRLVAEAGEEDGEDDHGEEEDGGEDARRFYLVSLFFPVRPEAE